MRGGGAGESAWGANEIYIPICNGGASLDQLKELLLEMDEAVGVDEARMHLDGQVVALEQLEAELLALQSVEAFLDLLDFELFQG